MSRTSAVVSCHQSIIVLQLHNIIHRYGRGGDNDYELREQLLSGGPGIDSPKMLLVEFTRRKYNLSLAAR